MTWLSFKHKTTYMVAINKFGFKVIKNVKVIFSKKFLKGEELSGLIFAEHLDTFLFIQPPKIYRKDIDEKPPYLLMDLSSFDPPFFLSGYSPLNKRLITLTRRSEIGVVNIQEKRV